MLSLLLLLRLLLLLLEELAEGPGEALQALL